MPAESDAPSSVGSDAASTNSSDQGDAVPALAGDDDRTDLLKNQTSLQDSVFGVQEDPRAGIAWVSGEGQLYCVSKGFMALLGYSFHDMRRNIQSIEEEEEEIKANVKADQSSVADSTASGNKVVVLIVLLVLVPLYYWYMLQPFYKRLGKESRRVAELLSQLPKSIDVQGLGPQALG
ncbi:hypothetical protein WJX77_000863 [Trebouxia sp. C0004]